jgi:hypothetical protein
LWDSFLPLWWKKGSRMLWITKLLFPVSWIESLLSISPEPFTFSTFSLLEDFQTVFHYIILYYLILHCIILCYIILYCIALHYITLYYIPFFTLLPFCTILLIPYIENL